MKHTTLLLTTAISALLLTSCEKPVPAITRSGIGLEEDMKDRSVASLPADYGIIMHLPPPHKYIYSLAFDERTGSLAVGIGISRKLLWLDGAGKTLARADESFDGGTLSWNTPYSYETYAYDEQGRECERTQYNTRQNGAELRIFRKFTTLYDGNRATERMTIYHFDKEQNCVTERVTGPRHDGLISFYDDGTASDFEWGDLRYTNDRHGNYKTYWHWEGGAWRFTNSYDTHHRLTKQVAKGADKFSKGERRVFTYAYATEGRLVEETRDAWGYHFALKTAYFYGTDGTLRLTLTKGGESIYNDPLPTDTPAEYTVHAEFHTTAPIPDVRGITLGQLQGEAEK